MSKTCYSPTEMSANLERALMGLGLSKASVVEMFPEQLDPNNDTPRRQFHLSVTEVTFRFEDYYQFLAHGLVLDESTGTLGIIHLLSTQNDGKQAKEAVRDRIEQAAYIRHLLMQSPRQPNAKRPFFVELVLVILDWEETAKLVGAVLKEIMQTATFLHTIGVSLLKGEEHEEPGAIRRAFPWLLTATRKWYQQEKIFQETADSRPALLDSLTLTDLRCPGQREWKFIPSQTLHVVHGQNGSGKSTLTESFELLVTGKIRRLKSRDGQVHDYQKVLTHRDVKNSSANLAATFHVECDYPPVTAAIEKTGFGPALAPTFSADAFCLDEDLSNRISRGTAAERAEVFLTALLQTEGKSLQERYMLERDWKNRVEQLPVGARRVLADGLVIATGFNDRGAAFELLGGNIGALEVFFQEVLAELEQKAVSMSSQLANAASYFQRSDLQSLWRKLRSESSQRLKSWRAAEAWIIQLARWEPSEKDKSVTEIGPVIHEVENLTALIDLLERECVVTETLAKAQEDYGYAEAATYFCGAAERTSLRAVQQKQQLKESRERLEQMTLQLQSATGSGGISKMRKPQLSSGMEEILNEIGRYLRLKWERKDWEDTALGTGIGRVLKDEQPRFLSASGEQQLTVGRVNQLGYLLARMKEVIGALEELVARPDDYPLDLGDFGHKLESLSEILTKRIRLGEGSLQAFQNKVSGALADALNELTALMTPARWAYQDLAAKVELGENQAMDLNVAGTPVALTLNTAELNTMTLALFLLCGLKSENPLRMLILDDPFQNMDELSVTTVSRGLARLMHVWGGIAPHHPWRLVLMLHGEENVERVRAEAPCAVYYLPWLAPALPMAPASPISGDQSRIGKGLISLDGKITQGVEHG